MDLLSILGYYFAIALGSTYGLWLFYLAIMNLQRANKERRLKHFALILGIPILVVGLVLDTIVNILVMTFVFLELPQEFLVTSRLHRHYRDNPESWRGKLAKKLSEAILDDFDPSGNHID